MAPRQQFGTTWWGKAWVAAVEEAAALDPNRLARGRTYARGGKVGAIEVHPGYATATVQGQHGRRYRTDVAVRALAPSEWEQVADAIGARAGHAAALFDGELAPGIVEDVAALDIRLLPGPGDLRPDCSCPDWAEPCKHAAALCYLLATELDRDPFLLFVLRGMARDLLLDLVRQRRGGADAAPPIEGIGVAASEVWANRAVGDPLPPLPTAVTEVLHRIPPAGVAPPSWDVAVPPALGLTAAAVDALAADAAERAAVALNDGASLHLALDEDSDLARRCVGLEPRKLSDVALRVGLRPGQMAPRVEAWCLGGAVAVAMLVHADLWSTDQTTLAAGREALVDLGYSRRSVSLNYDSLRMRGAVWLALGPDGRWYHFREKGQRRELHLTQAPSDDICDLVDPPDKPSS